MLRPEATRRLLHAIDRGRTRVGAAGDAVEHKADRHATGLPVRVHHDEVAAASADALGARAFTDGTHIAFGRSQYQPAQGAGQSLLAHELSHITQGHAASGVLRRNGPGDPVQPEQDGDRDIGGRPPGTRSFRQMRSSRYGWRTSWTRPRPASTDTRPLGCSARSLAVISSARS